MVTWCQSCWSVLPGSLDRRGPGCDVRPGRLGCGGRRFGPCCRGACSYHGVRLVLTWSSWYVRDIC